MLENLGFLDRWRKLVLFQKPFHFNDGEKFIGFRKLDDLVEPNDVGVLLGGVINLEVLSRLVDVLFVLDFGEESNVK